MFSVPMGSLPRSINTDEIRCKGAIWLPANYKVDQDQLFIICPAAFDIGNRMVST